VKRTLLFAAAGGLLIALLKFLEYKFVIRAYSAEVYGGALALIFTAVGIYAGLRLTKPKEVVVEREVLVPTSAPFTRDETRIAQLGITPRELEILQLMAEGLSNREIGERLFVSEHTVKSHSSRLFDKLDASRRTQAVQRGKEYRLIP
jgi:DNA-binding NarL/FixJ family response regulator